MAYQIHGQNSNERKFHRYRLRMWAVLRVASNFQLLFTMLTIIIMSTVSTENAIESEFKRKISI